MKKIVFYKNEENMGPYHIGYIIPNNESIFPMIDKLDESNIRVRYKTPLGLFYYVGVTKSQPDTTGCDDDCIYTFFKLDKYLESKNNLETVVTIYDDESDCDKILTIKKGYSVTNISIECLLSIFEYFKSIGAEYIEDVLSDSFNLYLDKDNKAISKYEKE